MVFCPQCKQQVDDCPHFVYPITAPRVRVFDPKIETLAYDEKQRILEIAFKTGQVWQLASVPPNIYAELSDSTMSSFLRFIARRYKVSPVKRGMAAVITPETENCRKCGSNMTIERKTGSDFDQRVRIFWKCLCGHHEMRDYGNSGGRERRQRYH